MHIRLGQPHEYDDEQWGRLAPVYYRSCRTRIRKTVFVEIDEMNGKGYCPRCTGWLSAEANLVDLP
jgi:hypothetical protein